MKESEIIFNKICRRYQLGEMLEEPVQLSGGFMHKMYSLFTTKGKYAVKLLNPYVMKREDAMSNYRTAEKLEAVLVENHIPVLAAHLYNGEKMQEIDGQYLYLFDWFDGAALQNEEITAYHCAKIGEVLARIHRIDCVKGKCEKKEMNIDWLFYIARLREENTELYELMKQSEDILYERQKKGNAAIKKLPDILAICHSDMDCKNVLWNGSDYRIIDLECLCYANPSLELFELALCWSGYESSQIDFDLYQTFIGAYKDADGIKVEDAEVLYDSNCGSLEWLEYNIKRVLGIDCGPEEKDMGISQVKSTLAHIEYYHKMKEQIVQNLDA